jgi:hypothetical protein
MRNSTISEQKNCKSKNFNSMKEKLLSIKKMGFLSITKTKNQVTNEDTYITLKQENNTSIHTLFQRENGKVFSSLFFLTSPIIDFPHSEAP